MISEILCWRNFKLQTNFADLRILPWPFRQTHLLTHLQMATFLGLNQNFNILLPTDPRPRGQ